MTGMSGALADYFARIGYSGTPRVDVETLVALHRAHLTAIPYENLDVQLGRPVTRDIAGIQAKLIHGRRGGWCYEMNGLLSWALEEIGFSLTRLAGGVMRAVAGDQQIGNHLVLLVHLDRPWLADVGFGDGLIDPVPLQEGPITQGFLNFRLERLDQRWWRFHNQPHGGAASFDFAEEAGDPALLDFKCHRLQTDPASNFTLNAILQRRTALGVDAITGRVLKQVRAGGVTKSLIPDAAAYVGHLRDLFGLDLPQAEQLWPKIIARHREVFGSDDLSAT